MKHQHPTVHHPADTVPAAVSAALAFAARCHAGQWRKGRQAPYFVHLLDALGLVLFETADEELLCAVVLHDILEDTDCSAEELEKAFGRRVLQLVEFATEPDNRRDIPLQEKQRSWTGRKQHAIDICSKASEDELLVSIADKTANLCSLAVDLDLEGDAVWTRFNATSDQICWYYTSLLFAYRKVLQGRRILQLYEKQLQRIWPDALQ